MNIDSEHESKLPWTGERYVPEVTGQVQLEHVHRYLLAREYAKDKHVLDIACGEGFGSAILATAARSVVGVDIAAEVVRHAAKRYRRPNVQFRRGSCVEIPLDNNSVDLVVSFETIEHHDEHKAMMAEIKRVLRPEGVLIISSPDKKEYSILPNYRNPFHVRELFKEEFEDLVRAYFNNLVFLSQRVVYGSVIIPDSGAIRVIGYDIKDSSRPHPGLARPRFLIVVASDEVLPPLSGGLLEQPVEESENVRSRSEIITQLEDQLRQFKEQLHSQTSHSESKILQLQGEASRFEGEVSQLEGKVSQLEGNVCQLEEGIARLNLEVYTERRLRQSMIASLSWRLTWPLRVLRDTTLTALKELTHRNSLPPESEAGPSNERSKTNSASEPLLTVFDKSHYLQQIPSAADSGAASLEHYQTLGWREGYNPHPLFDVRWYLRENPDVAQGGAEPLRHYLEQGWKEGRNPHPLFDVRFYQKCNPEVEKAGAEPLYHYISRGWREGLCPSALFDSVWYLKAYQDVADAGMEPLTHYWLYGISQGRFPRSIDKELADLPDRNFGKWAAERCTSFLSQTSEREVSEPPRNTAIKNLSEASLRARVDDLPEVSIVIPAHNQLDFTLTSVTAVLMSNPRRSFEIIIADDASTDETRSIFENLPNPIRYIRWDQNQGFLRSCNAAAECSRGRYLVFLNNDTIVFPGWLDPLIDTLEEQADAGLVGSKLLFPNGRLQEAGGIIWSDGSGMNFGRGDDPSQPRYNYVREVDYCSGCSLAISKELWTILGGFSETFTPAYYEDADLCFRARQRGKKVYYQPFSKLIHFDGISSGTSTNSGVKAYQEVNRSKFLDRWSETLQCHGSQANLPRIADRYSREHILVVDATIPTPDQDAGSVASLNFLRILKRLKKRITFVPSNLSRMDHYTSALEAIGVECLSLPAFSSLESAIRYVGSEIEFVFLHRVSVAKPIINFARRCAPHAKIIFNTIDLHFLREKREADLFGGRWRQDKAEKTKQDELEVIREADATIVLNESERHLLNELVPAARVFQIGLIGPAIHSPPAGHATWNSRRDIVFVGGFQHPPNCDAVQYFVREVWPILRDRGYSDRFIIVGSNAPRGIESLGNDHIIVKGHVENLMDVFSTTRLSVAPLRFGAGLKGKVAASLGFGVPCVATSIGVEGSGLLDQVNVLVGDTPGDFASHILRAYNDSQLWTNLSENGLRFFRENYSLEAIGAKVEGLMTALKPGNLELNAVKHAG